MATVLLHLLVVFEFVPPADGSTARMPDRDPVPDAALALPPRLERTLTEQTTASVANMPEPEPPGGQCVDWLNLEEWNSHHHEGDQLEVFFCCFEITI